MNQNSALPNEEPSSNSSDAPTLQISAELYKSLLSSAEQLKHIVAENASMARELRRIQQNKPSFPLFSAFPTEIRLQIWRSAFRTPRIHIMRKDHISRSQINSIMYACKESQELGLSLRMPFYYVHHPETLRPICGVQYFHSDIDTLWVDTTDRLPKNVILYDGHDVRQPMLLDKEYPEWTLSLGSLAMDAGNWVDPFIMDDDEDDYDDDEGRLYLCSFELIRMLNNNRELILVVGGPGLPCASDIVFTEPRGTPFLLAPSLANNESLLGNGRDESISPNATWESAARQAEYILRQAKKLLMEKMKKKIEDHKKVTKNERRLCDGVIPRVRFVETVDSYRQWICNSV
ncbi:uncharacterized protein LY89DRAFT_680076 [Mollisia scopiformis]|uniref:2EXR domain-containing protein n=1 Tax=Mollisia scopiformis TaxID=149040 RepID=A0A194XUC4_MOLSC|nr:uncharacterized protein LY89DRAFT_680076 [Mollisia scopiformis]KUJ23307.1 hypothetical protein LY89DRAFT_680076 [Mollisia scopiformis]